MTRFDFECNSLLKFFDKPFVPVLWAAFGFILVSIIVMSVIKKMAGLTEKETKPISILISVVWILGFIVEMTLYFSGIDGLEAFFVWCVIFIGYTLYTILNYREIFRLSDYLSRNSIRSLLGLDRDD